MNPDTCLYCDADLRIVGVREYGLITFQSHLHWDPKSDWYGTDDDRVTYGECHSIDYACPSCGRDLGFDPDDPDSY